MIKLYVFLAISFFSILGFSQDTINEKNFKISPPGTVWVKDNIYIDMFPVSNSDYTEFLYTVASYYNEEVHKLIQTQPYYKVNWKKLSSHFAELNTNDDYLKKIEQNYFEPLSWTKDSSLMFSYYDDEYYSNFPLINVTYEQANEYCKWRTDMVMLNYAINTKNEKQRSVFYKKMKYRLPTEKEWIDAYNLYELKNEPFTKPLSGIAEETEYFNYLPGNISEILLEKGKAIGVSWKDSFIPENPLPIKNYSVKADWLGFRCVCEIIEY